MSFSLFAPRIAGRCHRLFAGRVARQAFPAAWLGASVILAGLVGCRHGSPVVEEPASAQLPTGGYGESLSNPTGQASHSVTGKAVNERAAGQVEELLEARFPGVGVIRTSSGGFLIRIRGLGSFLGRPDPLYIIDGTPTEVHPQRGLDWINPSDIRRITVLKGPPETTLYGVRGANGVVVIETRIR
jgi:TonB-dependent SusC/RagA subfamily outer membrane receptor